MKRSIKGNPWVAIGMLAMWVALLAVPAPAVAQTGRRLAIFADEGLTQSTSEDNVPRIVSLLRITPADNRPCVVSPDTGCAWVEHCITDLGHLGVNCPVAVESATWGSIKALYR